MTEPSFGGSVYGQQVTEARDDREAQLLLERIPAVLWTIDRELRFISGTGTGLMPLGVQAGNLTGMSLFEYFRTDDAKFPPIAAHLRAIEGETVDYFSEWEGRAFQAHVEPLRGAEGHVIGCLGLALDVTERQRLEREQGRLLAEARAARAAAEEARQRSTFLAEAGRQLSSSLDYEATLQRVSRLAVPQLADVCMVAMPGMGGELRQVALALRDPAQEALALELWRRYPWSADAPAGLRRVMLTARPELYPDIPEWMLAAAAMGPEHLQQLRTFKLLSALLIPLVAHGKTLGVLTLVTSAQSGRRFSSAELSLAEELGARCALAVDNAQLYRTAQEAIQRRDESLASLDSLFKSAPVGLSLLDPDLRYLRINDTMAAINGALPERIRGRPVREVAVPAIAGRIESMMRRVLNTGMPIINVELSAATASLPGQLRHWLASYYPVRMEDGRTLGVGSMVVEVTQRKQAEEEVVRLYREAQEAIRVRDDFLSIASHELKTPLTPLSLRLQAVQKSLERGARVDIEQIRKARKHLHTLTTLINDLLDISRIQSGRLVLHPEAMPLRPLVREVVASFRPVSPKHEILLDEPREELVVQADRSRLEQVVQNLLENALKYSPHGGRVRVVLSAREGDALLSVSDEGIGIPREQQERLFQRYFRAQNVSSRSFGGLGLGLYICRDIVERHGGRIWVESEEGRGSTFFVALPRDSQRAEARR